MGENGLEVNITFFGRYLIGKMFVLTADKVADKNLFRKTHEELDNDKAFPIVNIGWLCLQDGYSSDEKQNDYLCDLMHEDILEILVTHENNVGVVQVVVRTTPEEDDAGVTSATSPCVCGSWSTRTSFHWSTWSITLMTPLLPTVLTSILILVTTFTCQTGVFLFLLSRRICR
jgi:hypothetical protein